MEFMPDGEQILKAYLKKKYDEGYAQGYVEGYVQGYAGTEKNRLVKAAANLLKKGLPAELIARSVELPLSEVNALKAQLAQ